MDENMYLLKHTAAIHIINSLTLTQRKVVNILLKNAFPNLDKDIEHTISLSHVMDFLGWGKNSEATKLLRDSLKNLNLQQIEWNIFQKDRKKVWGVTTLLAHVQISNGQIEYTYSKPLRELLHKPNIYARLNLLVQKNFSNKHALVLWEYMCECLCSCKVEQVETEPISMGDFKKLLGIQNHKGYLSFSSLNAQVIKPALFEINERSDIHVTVKFKKQGKKVTALSFTSSRKHKNDVCVFRENVFDFLTHQAKEIGISEHLMKQHLKLYPTDKIKKALEIVTNDIKSGKKIHSYQAYYVACLKNGWEKSTAFISTPDLKLIDIDLSKIQKDFYAQERQELLKKVGSKTYASWFQNVTFETTSHKELIVKASSPFCADYIRKNFSNVILETWKKYDLKELKVA